MMVRKHFYLFAWDLNFNEFSLLWRFASWRSDLSERPLIWLKRLQTVRTRRYTGWSYLIYDVNLKKFVWSYLATVLLSCTKFVLSTTTTDQWNYIYSGGLSFFPLTCRITSNFGQVLARTSSLDALRIPQTTKELPHFCDSILARMKRSWSVWISMWIPWMLIKRPSTIWLPIPSRVQRVHHS